MGFFDTYEDEAITGVSWVKKAETAALIEDKTVLSIVDIKYRPGFDPGTHEYVIFFTTDDDPETTYAKSFRAGSVQSRDRMLDAMREYLEGDDAEPPAVRIVEEGRSKLLVSA